MMDDSASKEAVEVSNTCQWILWISNGTFRSEALQLYYYSMGTRREREGEREKRLSIYCRRSNRKGTRLPPAAPPARNCITHGRDHEKTWRM